MPSIAHKTSAILEIQRLAAELARGEETRIVCPHCGGGSSGERSLSIRRIKPFVANYTCWRATCDLGYGNVTLRGDGKVLYNSRMAPRDVQKQDRSIRSAPLLERHARYLKRYYRLTDELLAYGQVKSTSRGGRIIYNIFSPDRKRRGKTVRMYKELLTTDSVPVSLPKCINELNNEKAISQSWYYKGRELRKQTDTLIVVEDIVSALRVNPYYDSVALLGTVFNSAKQREIRMQGYKNVIICLDKDATRTAARYSKTAGVNVPGLKVKFLNKDIKNMDDNELQEFVRDIESKTAV